MRPCYDEEVKTWLVAQGLSEARAHEVANLVGREKEGESEATAILDAYAKRGGNDARDIGLARSFVKLRAAAGESFWKRTHASPSSPLEERGQETGGGPSGASQTGPVDSLERNPSCPKST